MGANDFVKLSDSNYSQWLPYMKAYLKKIGAWDIVNGTSTEPPPSSHAKRFAWRKLRDLAHAEIDLHVKESQLIHTISDDPAVVWITIESVHVARGFSTHLQRHDEFLSTRMTEDMSIQTYISLVRSRAKACLDANASCPDDDIIITLIRGLPPSFEGFKISLDSVRDSDLTLEYVVSRC
jgi:hypothetical protein